MCQLAVKCATIATMTDAQTFWCATYTAGVARGFSSPQAKAAADDAVAAYTKSFPSTPPTPPKLIPVYRLRKDAEHFLTASAAERDSSIATYGYTLEGIAFYAYDTSGS